MSKLIKFDEEAYAKINEGIELHKKAVGATLGPRAHNVLYGRPFGAPGVVHDGVTVSKELDHKDPFIQAVMKHIDSSASATNDEAGDGTTTAVILTHSLYTEGRKLVTAGHNAQMLRKGVEQAVEKVSEWLQRIATPIKTNEQQLQIAIISSQNERIGKEVAKAFKKLGNEAVIAVEESKQNHIYSEYKDGMEIDQGYVSRYFVTNQQFDEAEVEKANIVVTDYTLSTVMDMQQLFESLQEVDINNSLVIITPEIKDIALATLIQNRVNGGLSTLAVRAPSYGDEQAERLEDIAISVGGRFISKDSGKKLSQLEAEDIGHAQKVVASKDTTTIINGLGEPSKIQARVDELKKRMEKETISEFEAERLQERIAKLTSGIAIINVGARTEGEAKELKERTIDAVEAIKAANEKGIVAGGETALLRASWELERHLKEIQASEEFLSGYKLVIKAMQHPFFTLMENSGLNPGQMLERLMIANNAPATQTDVQGVEVADINRPNLGIDVIDGKVKDLVQAGVIDPVKVPISALLNATSAAMSLLTSGVLIVDEVPDKDANKV